MKNILNIINFVRAVEPREKDDSYLLSTFRREMELNGRYGFKNTVLLQYDALIKDEYREIIEKYRDITEVGLWLEIVQPLAEHSSIAWRGRFPWDWHNHVGFTVGYDPEERKKLVDTAFRKFREYYGFYPSVVGSWHIDAFTLRYMSEKYGITASCNCRDQYGTDGYTIWGGYYAGAYYPSKYNMLCPANTAENQINVPVFRMLGSDPVYQYDMGLGRPDEAQGVVTLEPVYEKGGGDRKWVEWYLKENFNGKGLALSYTQTGQENSFGWDRISGGLPMQYEVISRKIAAGEIELMTLGEAGNWFRKSFPLTPVSSVCADSDCECTGVSCAWYNSRFYRMNLFFDGEKAWIRDLHVFDENYRERFLFERDEDRNCGYYNLPVIDGFRFSKDGIRAGIYVTCDGKFVTGTKLTTETDGENTLKASLDGKLTFILNESEAEISSSLPGWKLEFIYAETECVPYRVVTPKKLQMHFDGYDGNGCDYAVSLSQGTFKHENGKISVVPENGTIKFELEGQKK